MTDYVTLFKALANPHRLKIYQMLMHCCEPGTACTEREALSTCVSDIDEQLEIAPSTLSHHLKELHRAGLLNMQKKGKQVFYSINTEITNDILTFFVPAQHDQTS